MKLKDSYVVCNYSNLLKNYCLAMGIIYGFGFGIGYYSTDIIRTKQMNNEEN